jgi:hypothetical protein
LTLGDHFGVVFGFVDHGVWLWICGYRWSVQFFHCGCTYLRMPYETDTASEKHREGEREVRHTIIRDHLREPSTSTTWCGRDLDFANATFDGGDFFDAKFTGGEVSFGEAEYTGGEVSFGGTEYTPDCSIRWGPFEPPAAWTALQERERRQNEPLL